MKFIIQEPLGNQNFSLVYYEKSYGFGIEPFVSGLGGSSILINDLQLEMNEQGRIAYVWGYCPLVVYEETDLFPQKYKNYTLFVLLDYTEHD